MIKGVIYDMDDLMVNTYPLYHQATEGALNQLGYSLTKIPKAMQASFPGRRTLDVYSEIIDYFKINISPASLFQRMGLKFFKKIEKELNLLPGVIMTLKLFKKEGLKIALGSSGTKKYIDVILNKFDLESYFEVIVAGDQIKKGKPDPEIYQTVTVKLGINPRECLVLEDATAGIKSAKAAGCKCIAIKNTFTPPQDLSQADLILNSLEEINLKIIKSLFN